MSSVSLVKRHFVTSSTLHLQQKLPIAKKRFSLTPPKINCLADRQNRTAALKVNTNKYAHVSSKVETHWTSEEKQRIGIKKFFERNKPFSGSTSLTTSTPSSANVSTDSICKIKSFPKRSSLNYQLSGPDFAHMP